MRIDPPSTGATTYPVTGQNERIISAEGTFQLTKVGGTIQAITPTVTMLPYDLNFGDIVTVRSTDGSVSINPTSLYSDSI